MKEYIYGLFYDGEQIDQTSLDESNKELALEIMMEDNKEKDQSLLILNLIEEREALN